MPSAQPYGDYTLTQEQIDSFLENGYIKLTNCFSHEKAADWTASMWQRLGYEKDDPSTWKAERVNMPWHRSEPVRTFAPKAWAGMCQLDNLIVNFGSLTGDTSIPHPHTLPGWHTDGDFFTHYLDSPEQALLVLPLFSDIAPSGGGTIICPEGIAKVAQHLYAHPEGVSPRMVPRADFNDHEDLSIFRQWARESSHFVEATGEVGDVYLIHPFMLHTASRNSLRTLRIITNPNLAAKEPFNFNRANAAEYSAVERCTLRALGRESLPEWKAMGPREIVEPERVQIQEKMKQMEVRRMKGEMVEGSALDGLGEVNRAAPRVRSAA